MSKTETKSPVERLDMLVESMRIVSSPHPAMQLMLAATVAIRDELVALGKDRDDLQRQIGQIRQPDPRPTPPPIGTSHCRQAQVCDRYGNCRWQQVCR